MATVCLLCEALPLAAATVQQSHYHHLIAMALTVAATLKVLCTLYTHLAHIAYMHILQHVVCSIHTVYANARTAVFSACKHIDTRITNAVWCMMFAFHDLLQIGYWRVTYLAVQPVAAAVASLLLSAALLAAAAVAKLKAQQQQQQSL
jgi:hypothetical protein